MTDYTELIERLRSTESEFFYDRETAIGGEVKRWRNPDGPAAADALEAQWREIESLREAMKTGVQFKILFDEEVAKLHSRLAEAEALLLFASPDIGLDYAAGRTWRKRRNAFLNLEKP